MRVPVEKKTTKMTFPQVIDFFNSGIQEAETLLSPARSSKLQLAQCKSLDVLSFHASEFKKQAIQKNQENEANILLAFECSIGAIRSELLMWILLKLDMPNEAWERLVAAQMGYLDSTRAHEGLAKCGQRLKDLEMFENHFFPPQEFVSAGFIAKRLDCSICGENYSKCDHLRGKPYGGEFCDVVHRDLEADHIALVETPADKRCRVVSFKTKEGYRDKISWEITPYEDSEVFNDRDDYLEAKTIFLSIDRSPYMSYTEQVLNTQLQTLVSDLASKTLTLAKSKEKANQLSP